VDGSGGNELTMKGKGQERRRWEGRGGKRGERRREGKKLGSPF